MTNEDLIELRAALIQLTKAQERQIDAEKRIISRLTKMLGLDEKQPATILSASIAGAVGNTVTTT